MMAQTRETPCFQASRARPLNSTVTGAGTGRAKGCIYKNTQCPVRVEVGSRQLAPPPKGKVIKHKKRWNQGDGSIQCRCVLLPSKYWFKRTTGNYNGKQKNIPKVTVHVTCSPSHMIWSLWGWQSFLFSDTHFINAVLNMGEGALPKSNNHTLQQKYWSTPKITTWLCFWNLKNHSEGNF